MLAIRPRDAHRYGYRLWADHASGLLLRAEVLGERGDVLETSAFSDVTIGVRPQPESVLHAMKKLDGYRVVKPVLTPTRLELEGWTMRQVAPGFRAGELRQPADGGARRRRGATPSPPVHPEHLFRRPDVCLGLHRAVPAPSGIPSRCSCRSGATSTLSQRQGDWWVTVVGDTPPATFASSPLHWSARKP